MEPKLPAKIPIIPFILLFLISILIFPGITFIIRQQNQKAVDQLADKAEYPEIEGRMPTFTVDVTTPDSTTHVLSYLPAKVLAKEDFDEKAAADVIAYVERFTKKEDTYILNPYATDGLTASMKLVPRWTSQAEHFVFLISDKEPIPSILEDSKDKFSLLSDSLDTNVTLFWTQPLTKGSVSFLRFTENKTWRYGLPTVNQEFLTTRQQLNVGFNIEIWKRSALFTHDFSQDNIVDHDKYIFDSSESLWNTFGQLVVAKQENIPIELMKQRFDKRILNRQINMAYYPFDQKSKELYENAPTSPIIK